MRRKYTSDTLTMSLFEGKVCTRCNQWKPETDFHIRKNQPIAQCRKCTSDCSKQRRLANLEKVRQRDRERYIGRAESVKKKVRLYASCNREKVQLYKKLWREKNASTIAEKKREWREQNIDYVKKYDRQRDKNPERREKNQVRMSKRNATRKNGSDGTLTHRTWIALCEKYNYCCLCCGKPGKMTVDHIVPLIKGGSHSLSNIQPLCLSCNSRKCDKTIDYRP